jgi:hypothetical protein
MRVALEDPRGPDRHRQILQLSASFERFSVIMRTADLSTLDGAWRKIVASLAGTLVAAFMAPSENAT